MTTPSNNAAKTYIWMWILFVALGVVDFMAVIKFRQDFAPPLHRILCILLYPDIGHGIFWGALLITFVASVMGQDQKQRLDQGKFGFATGTSLGGISGLIDKQPTFLVVGFVGSAVGGLLGWLFYFILACLVNQSPKLKNLVIFQTGGLDGLQKQLNLQSKETLRDAFKDWTEKFTRMMSQAKMDLLALEKSDEWEHEAKSLIRGWLVSAVDTLALVFGTLADKRQYESRVTIIVYRLDTTQATPKAKGKHWISYSNNLRPHLKDKLFNESSVGFKVLHCQLQSPYFTTQDQAQKDGQERDDEDSYRPFVTIRLNDTAILAVDWPQELKEDDDYVKAAQSLFNSAVAPAVAELLNQWPTNLADLAGVPAS